MFNLYSKRILVVVVTAVQSVACHQFQLEELRSWGAMLRYRGGLTLAVTFDEHLSDLANIFAIEEQIERFVAEINPSGVPTPRLVSLE